MLKQYYERAERRIHCAASTKRQLMEKFFSAQNLNEPLNFQLPLSAQP